LYFRISLVYC